jgi:hypothetical protein
MVNIPGNPGGLPPSFADDNPLFGHSFKEEVAGVTGLFGQVSKVLVPLRLLPVRAGVFGDGGTANGVLGESYSATDSGVWGNNFKGGFGVSGTSKNGIGVYGKGSLFGIKGETSGAESTSIVGDNTGGGAGIAGTSDQPGGTGVYGRGAMLAARFDGKVAVNGDVAVDGNIDVTGDIRLVNADCAEDFDIAGLEKVEPGTVMVIESEGALIPCTTAYDKRVAGVISGAGKYKPGIVLDKQESSNYRMPIALMGKVYCKVDASYGAIEVGDLLTTSPTVGHAMRTDDPFKAFGTVIGKALLPLESGQGLIPILIALQ